ncbi:hypothetical protein QQ045_001171 [Rhodiola kirilowii]
MRKFREALLDCSLRDIGYSGPSFTFSNRRKGEEETRIRLDRVLANMGWLMHYPKATVLNGWALHSDHRPIILSLVESGTMKRHKFSPTFRFEPMWLRDATFKEEKFGNVGNSIRRLKHIVEELQSAERTEEIIEKEIKATNELDEWMTREELLWRQRSRTEWLKAGDRNTAFFKVKATSRRNKKWIQMLKKEDGAEVCNNDDILSEFTNYFKHLFHTSEELVADDDWEAALDMVPVKVTSAMNQKLDDPYTINEVRAALFQMHPTKAPGVLDESLNETLIVLVPKVKGACKVGEFRPISLCNVIMKIITKVLANRLQCCLEEIVSQSQSAFVKGRLILDNILVAHEVTNFIKHRKLKQEAFVSLKIDMSKAYDRIEWTFLEKMLLKLGFSDTWTSRVMKCITSVSYKVKVNGELSGSITPGRGLRQGDHISPYLFILCQEWLSLKLDAEQRKATLMGVRLSRGIAPVNHLFFADDCLLFLKADMHILTNLKRVLEIYSRVSGQQINFQKSELCGSNNIDEMFKYMLAEYMGMKAVDKHTKYLGLPLIVGQNKVEVFRSLEDKMSKRIQDWGALLLSAAGKEALRRKRG